MIEPHETVIRKLVDLICSVKFSANTEPHPFRVAVDGVDGAGKTTLSDALTLQFEKIGRPVIRSSMDGFHNPRAVRYRRGANSPEGYYRDSFNNRVLVRDLLIPLGPGGNRKYRREVFNLKEDKPLPEDWQEAPADAILLFDGVFLLRNELIQYWDLSIFLEVDFRVSVNRAVQRDIAVNGGKWDEISRREHYERRYVPGQQLYIDEVRPRQKASIIVDNNDYQIPKIIKVQDGSLGPSY